MSISIFCIVHTANIHGLICALCRAGAKISTLARNWVGSMWWIHTGRIWRCTTPFNDPPEGSIKILWLSGEHLCWLVCAFHHTAINKKQFSSSEEMLQTFRGARGLRDLPVHFDSCQEQWQQWEGQWRNFASDFSGASPHCLGNHGPEPDNQKHW